MTRVTHVSGMVEKVLHEGLDMYEQRCTHCGTLLKSSRTPLTMYDNGDLVERGEEHNADGVLVRVLWSAVPLYRPNPGLPVVSCKAVTVTR